MDKEEEEMKEREEALSTERENAFKLETFVEGAPILLEPVEVDVEEDAALWTEEDFTGVETLVVESPIEGIDIKKEVEIQEDLDESDEEKGISPKGEEELSEEEKKEIAMQGKSEQRGNIIFYTLLALMLIGAMIFRHYWENTFGGVVVDGASMNQTLQDGDELLMKKLKDVDDLQRGDVIVVKVSEYEEFAGSSTQYLIKRLIAMEGDAVRCIDGQIEIRYAGTTEYVALEETYAYYYQSPESYDFAEYEVGVDEIFFLGDNRQNSCDSRYKEVGGSHLDRLYKEQDVYGVVPDWAIENRSWLRKIFFWKNK